MNFTEILPNVPTAAARHLLATLCASLPLPIPNTPAGCAARDEAAIAAVVGLRPRNAAEAMLAVQIVTTDAHAAVCLHFAAQPGQGPELVRRYRAQAAALSREVQIGLRTLLHDQTSRRRSAPATTPGVVAGADRWLRDPAPAAPSSALQPVLIDPAAEAKRQRAARIRALDLRVIETPATRH